MTRQYLNLRCSNDGLNLKEHICYSLQVTRIVVQWNLFITRSLGPWKLPLYQVSHYIRVKKQRNIKSWDQQNYLVIRGFCYIRPRYNEVPLYIDIYHRQNCKRRYIDLPSSLYLYIDTSRHILHQMDENKQVATRECTLIPGKKYLGFLGDFTPEMQKRAPENPHRL